jgi:hypothetical protein
MTTTTLLIIILLVLLLGGGGWGYRRYGGGGPPASFWWSSWCSGCSGRCPGSSLPALARGGATVDGIAGEDERRAERQPDVTPSL